MGDQSPTTGSIYINCITNDGFYVDDYCTFIGCVILNTTWNIVPQTGVRIVGCRDINGDFDDNIPNKGVEPASFTFNGSSTLGTFYQYISGYGDNRMYESDKDTITSIIKYDVESGLAERNPTDPDTLNFSFIKKWNGTFAQDGITNDTIWTLELGESIPLHTSGLGLSIYLYSGGNGNNSFSIEYVDNVSIKILNSWTNIQPLLTNEGKLHDDVNKGIESFLYFPYVVVNNGAISSIGKQWVVQCQRRKNTNRLYQYNP